jgi:nicotinamide-nucleotide amidase
MRAYLITIGNELLLGDTVNTNVAWLGTFLSRYNIEPVKSVTIGDDQAQIIESLSEGLNTSDLVIMTGGLGPTHDDITKKTIADYFNVGFKEHTPTREFIEKIFKKRGIPISPSNYDQAMVPENCEVLFNKNGTAPGMWFDLGNNALAVLPGVPIEMKGLMEEHVLPRFKSKMGIGIYALRHYIQTAGIGESTLSDLVIGNLDSYFSNGTQLAYLPHTHGITLRISCVAPDKEAAEAKTAPLIHHIREKARDFIFSEEYEASLESVVGTLLLHKKRTLATAESCTGGLIGSKITDVAGSSAYYAGGIVAYSNELKHQLLDVPQSLIETHGAVSKEVALAMAKGVAQKTKADIGISTTGIAGPGGGSPEKPVGLVWFGYYDGTTHFALKVQFFKNRIQNKERTALVALDLVRRVVSGIKVMPYNLEPEFAE